ncbi:MAG: operon transcription antiterminator [Herbinix sp.]|nr:operon transcription antiterminator [Herbinix sp.]
MKKDNQQLLIKHLSNAKDWISADELASYLHISSRTIRNYVIEINKSNNIMPLILSSQNGYRLNPNATSSGEFYKTDKSLSETPNERHYYIIRKLLNQNKVSIIDLTDTLFISERTLEVDILEISSLIKNYDLKIHRNKDYIQLNGDELNKRKLYIYVIKYTEDSKLTNFNFIKYIFPEFDVTTICNIAKKHINEKGLNINGFLFYDFLLILIIQIIRIQGGNYIDDDSCLIPDIHQYPDYQAALNIIKDLEEKFDYNFRNGELYFLCISLISTTDYSNASPLLTTPSFKNTYDKLQNVLQFVENFFNYCFIEEEFLMKLTHHFQRIQIRSSFNFLSSNSAFFDIRNKHPFLYEVATHIVDRIQDRQIAAINQEEIDFIAFQLGCFLKEHSTFESRVSGVLVCPSYYNITNTIINEIKSNTSNQLELTEIYDTLDIEKLADNMYSSKLIISVIPIVNLPNVITISPFLSSNDFQIINNKIFSLKRTIYLQELKQYLDKYLPNDFFEINHYFKDSKAAINHLCKKLVDENYVDENYEYNVLKREAMSSTSFFNIVALPHSSMLNAHKSAIQIIINNRPMLWKDEHINVIAMIVISNKDSYHFHIIYDLFVRIFSDSKIVKQILMVKDLESFMNIFQRVI